MTTIISLIQTIFRTLDALQPLALLAARLTVAGVFWRSGMQKLSNWEGTLALFATDYKLPLLPTEFSAYSATFFEISCAVLLAVGLCSRAATLPLLAITAVIKFLVYPNDAQAIYWAVLLLIILTFGAGKLSVDYFVKKRFFFA